MTEWIGLKDFPLSHPQFYSVNLSGWKGSLRATKPCFVSTELHLHRKYTQTSMHPPAASICHDLHHQHHFEASWTSEKRQSNEGESKLCADMALQGDINIPALCFSTLHPHPSSLGVSSGIPTQQCTRLLTNTSLVRSFLLLSLLSW